MSNKPVSINLVKGRKKGFFDKFIRWSLSIGRLVVIVTEVIALSAFLYRFSLDMQLIDLHDKIVQKQSMVKLLKKNEDKYRNLQDRLAIASKLSNKGISMADFFKDVISLASTDVVFSDIFLTGDYIRIEAKAQSVTSLANFVKTIKDYPKIDSVSIDTIENKTSNATITVRITAKLKKIAS